MKAFKIIGAMSLLLITSCTTDLGTSTYQSSSLGRAQVTLHGTIISVREVAVETPNHTGTAIGTGVGAMAGALIGGSNNRFLGAGLGGAVGAAAGHAIKPKSKTKAYEYQVAADNGQIYTMVQGSDVVLQPGQRVSVILPDGSSNRGRILPL